MSKLINEGSSTLINLKSEVVAANGSITATVWLTCCLGFHKGEPYCDVDFTDITDVTFMGMEIGDYTDYANFKKKMKEVGIDINSIICKEAEKLMTEELKQSLISQLRKMPSFKL